MVNDAQVAKNGTAGGYIIKFDKSDRAGDTDASFQFDAAQIGGASNPITILYVYPKTPDQVQARRGGLMVLCMLTCGSL